MSGCEHTARRVDRTVAIALAALLGLGAVAFFAREAPTRTGSLSKSRSDDERRVPATEATTLLVPPDGPSRVAERAEAGPATAPVDIDAARATPHEATPPARVVTLFRHATHDPSFPGERWTVALGRTEAGVAFVADEASAVEVPVGLVAVLLDHGDPEEVRAGRAEATALELGSGLHNLAPYGFNDRVDAVEVRAARAAADTAPLAVPEDVTLSDALDGTTARIGRVWVLRLPAGAGTRLFTAREGAYEEGAPRELLVPPGHEATFFVEPDGRGQAFVFGPGRYDLMQFGRAREARSVRVLDLAAARAR